jgi:hypothetical protein
VKALDAIVSLEATFAGETLLEVAGALESADEWTTYSGPLLLLSMICRRLGERWDSPVSHAEAEEIRSRFLPLINNLAKAISEGRTPSIPAASNALATEYRDTELI